MMGVRGENIKIFLAWLYSVAFFGEYLNKVSGLITIQPNNKTLHGMERDCFGNKKKKKFNFLITLRVKPVNSTLIRCNSCNPKLHE